MLRITPKRSRGMTLIEVIFFCAIMTTVAVFTMRSLGQARAVRGRAADRAVMALSAQTELDRVRRVRPQALAEGITTQSLPHIGAGAELATSLARRQDGNWTVDVVVNLASVEGNTPVRLSTIRKGSGS